MSDLRARLEAIQELIRTARRNVPRGDGSEPQLSNAEKEIKVVKLTNRTYLQRTTTGFGTWYDCCLFDVLGNAQEAIDDFRNGHGWECLDRAVDHVNTVAERVGLEAKRG